MKYERGDLPKNEWLDKLAFRKMEEIHAVSAVCFLVARLIDRASQDETKASEHMFLYIDVPQFDCPVVFLEQVGEY